MAFRHSFSFVTLFAANFGCDWVMPTLQVVVLFNWNLKAPFLGQVFDLDLLLCTGFYLVPLHQFYCKWSKDWANHWSYPHRSSILHEKSWHSPRIKMHLAFLTLELSQYLKSDDTTAAELFLLRKRLAFCLCLSTVWGMRFEKPPLWDFVFKIFQKFMGGLSTFARFPLRF